MRDHFTELMEPLLTRIQKWYKNLCKYVDHPL